jgi:MtrB/PioB family decaheme-associated outer membrane protein
MSRDYTRPLLHLTAVLVSGLASGSLLAQDYEKIANELRMDLATPDTRIDVGVGMVSGDARRFGTYNGMSTESAYGLLNLDLVQRDDATGTWFRLKGNNLGVDNRHLRLEHQKQGDWAYHLDAGHYKFRDPRVFSTGLGGIGTASLTVSAAKRNIDLSVAHDSFAAGFRKFVIGGLELRASFKQDERSGDRAYGQGTTTGPTINFLTEAIDRVTREWDLTASYSDKTLQLTGGYSGSSFQNKLPSILIAGGIATFSPTAAPPSNQAHKFHLSGGYNFGETGRGSFKLSRSIAKQDSVFVTPPTLPGNRETSPGGREVTTLAYADLTLRPADRLDLSAQLRFEDRDDQSRVAQYLTPVVPTATAPLFTAGITGFNIPRTLKQLKGMVEAGYQLDDGYRLIAGLEHEQTRRSVPFQYRRIAYRERTDETQARVEIKRMLSETLNGGLAFIHGFRGGSAYVPDTYSQRTNQLHSLIWADRQRDKLRLSADWIPDEDWSLQFRGDVGSDRYSGRELGPRKGDTLLFSTDVAYQISSKWQTHAWLSQERILIEQETRSDINPALAAAGGNVLWQARVRNTTTALGVGLKGRPKAHLELGADLSVSADSARHELQRTGGSGTGAITPTSLPDYVYRQLTLKLHADHALDRHSGIRGEFIVDRMRNNDWTWRNWTYTDGTTVTLPDRQNAAFLGVTYYHRMR